MGIVVSSFAIGSSAGLLLGMGLPYISQVTVMPFLAFAIGSLEMSYSLKLCSI